MYSTIKFAVDGAKNLEIQTTIVTFDQPMWLKLEKILKANLLSVFLILSWFHLLISFCESAGYVIKGSKINKHGTRFRKHISLNTWLVENNFTCLERPFSERICANN